MPARRAAAVRAAAIAATVAALAGAASLVPAKAASAPTTPAEPTLGALISATEQYVGGTYVWTDYAYDDRGPDTNDRPGGDTPYATSGNAADLIQLQVAPADAGLSVTAVLETLRDGDPLQPVVGVAFDTDGDPSTGAEALPGSWVASAPLGVDRLYVLEGPDGIAYEWRDADGGTWIDSGTFSVAVDTRANTLRATVPFTLPATGVLRTVAVAGPGSDGASWVNGDRAPTDLAFVVAGSPILKYLDGVAVAVTGFGGDGETQWQEYEQSAILAGKAAPGSGGSGVAEIDVAKLRSNATELAGIREEKGFYTFLYRSGLDLGEGVSGQGNSALYNGPYQPYTVWAPGATRMEPGLPLVLYLHGSSQTHLSSVNLAHYDEASQQAGRPDAIFDFDAVVAWPLGRGPQSNYLGAAEQDPLDVADDVIRRLSLDRDRVMLAGLSMGGIGTFKLAERYPDRWSVAYSDVGADRTGLPENLTALPVRLQNAVADPLVSPPIWRPSHDALAAAGTVDHRAWVLLKGTHGPAIGVAECVYRESFRRPRVKNPVHVRYTVDPSTFVEDPKSGLRLRPDSAYWVSGIVTSGGRGSVDLTTKGLGRVRTPGAVTTTSHQNVTGPADFCGDGGSSTVRTNDAWTQQARVITEDPAPAKRQVVGTLTELAALTVTADRAGIGGRAPAELLLRVIGDRNVSLTLTGLAPGVAVSNGTVTVRADGKGRATIELPARPASDPTTVSVTIG